MKVLCSILFFFFLIVSITGQNLVPNGGFEDANATGVKYWDQPKGEYYHLSMTSFRNFNKIDGLCFTATEGNEYLQTRLLAPLVKGKKYHLSLWIMAGHKDLGKVECLFSPALYEIKNRMNIQTKAQVSFKLNPLRYNIWTPLEINYVAKGNEVYLLIGRFDNKLDYSKEYDFSAFMKKAEKEKEVRRQQITDSFDRLFPVWTLAMEKRASKKEKIAFDQKIQELSKNEKEAIDETEAAFQKVTDSVYAAFDVSLPYHFRAYIDNVCLALIKDDGSYSCADTAIHLTSADSNRLVLNSLLFETDKAIIQDISFPELDMLVQYMKDKPGLRIKINGYTDNVGSEEHNKSLSAARAAAVANYLIKKGIAESRIKSVGFGAGNPVASNNGEEGRRLNRRVEVEFEKY